MVSNDKPLKKSNRAVRQQADPYIRETEDKLRDILGTQVRIHENKKAAGGKIEIEYYSNADIERILELVEQIQ